MSDTTVVNHEPTGPGGRIKSVIMGFLMSPLFILAGIIALSWNEGRSVDQIRTLAMAEKILVEGSVDDAAANPEGALVHVSGLLTAQSNVTDDMFGLDVDALGIRRSVEMYQWTEEKKTEDDKTTYTYKKAWVGRQIDSSGFETPAGHENPGPFPVQDRSSTAPDMRLGALELGSSLERKVSFYEDYAVTPEMAEAMPEGVREQFSVMDGKLVNFEGAPEVGALRIGFGLMPEQDISVIAKNASGRLEPYRMKKGTIDLLSQGTVSADEMLTTAKARNQAITWGLRAVGAVLVVIGFNALISPLTALAGVVPVLGGIVRSLGGMVATGVALGVSLVTISIAWITVRPILGGALLVAAVVIGFGVMSMRKKESA